MDVWIGRGHEMRAVGRWGGACLYVRMDGWSD